MVSGVELISDTFTVLHGTVIFCTGTRHSSYAGTHRKVWPARNGDRLGLGPLFCEKSFVWVGTVWTVVLRQLPRLLPRRYLYSASYVEFGFRIRSEFSIFRVVLIERFCVRRFAFFAKTAATSAQIQKNCEATVSSEPFLSRVFLCEDSHSSQENFWRGLNRNFA